MVRTEHSGFLGRAFGRGQLYLHHIVEALEARNMPRELALLPVIESAFDPFARSRSHALGALAVHPRNRPALRAGTRLVARRTAATSWRRPAPLSITSQELHEEFAGDWLLALAAYNAGEGECEAGDRAKPAERAADRLLRARAAAGDPDLRAEAAGRRSSGRRTQSVRSRSPEIPNAPYFVHVEIEHQIDLGRLADLAEIPREELRALNPAFNRWVTAPRGTHRLLVPAPDEVAGRERDCDLAPERAAPAPASSGPSRRHARRNRAPAWHRSRDAARRESGSWVADPCRSGPARTAPVRVDGARRGRPARPASSGCAKPWMSRLARLFVSLPANCGRSPRPTGAATSAGRGAACSP